jgi:hypothetical protein
MIKTPAFSNRHLNLGGKIRGKISIQIYRKAQPTQKGWKDQGHYLTA